MNKPLEPSSWDNLGQTLFRLRDYTPIPLILILLFVQQTTVLGATIGTLCVLLGEALRIYSVAFIGSISRTRKSHVGSRLIQEGPFQWVRNPLYVGNFFIALGFSMFSGKLWFVLLMLIAFAVQYSFIVTYEEARLAEVFGEEYTDYQARVPAWIPRRIPPFEEWKAPSEGYAKAIKSEQRTFMSVGAMFLLLLLFQS